jgi:hypothetical protein
MARREGGQLAMGQRARRTAPASTREGHCYQHVQAITVAIDQYAEKALGGCKPGESPGVLLFHNSKGPAPFHSIDNLISIEDRDKPVHCTRGVPWAWRDVFSEDAPGILHRSQYSLLISVVHGTHLTER